MYRRFHVSSCSVYCTQEVFNAFTDFWQKCLIIFCAYNSFSIRNILFYLWFSLLNLCNANTHINDPSKNRFSRTKKEQSRPVRNTLHPIMTGISVWRRLNSAMETVTETWSRVRHVSLVGMNSSKFDISSGVAGPWLSSTISTETVTQQKETC